MWSGYGNSLPAYNPENVSKYASSMNEYGEQEYRSESTHAWEKMEQIFNCESQSGKKSKGKNKI